MKVTAKRFYRHNVLLIYLKLVKYGVASPAADNMTIHRAG